MRQLKKYYIRTYGCQMNEQDSEVMEGALQARGMAKTDDEHNADLILFNTCSVRDLAERKVMGKLGLLGRNLKSDPIIGVTGCMANSKKETLLRKLPHIDFVLGTNNIHDLNTILDDVIATGKQHCLTDKQFHHELDYLAAKREDKLKACVTIIRGCDKFCTYCIVPYTRGPEVSRSPASIVEECQYLASQGYKEITLLGQNVNSYGKDHPEWSCLFHDLLYQLDKIPGIERIRFMTSHPVDITRGLMEAVRDLPSLCELVHFPMQAGSSRILKKMHRIYTIEEYLEKVALFKEIAPDVCLGTDIIVGFPTETHEEFMMSYELMKQIRFSLAYIFSYSPRNGTPAMRWADDVPEEVKQERLQSLLTLQEEISLEERMNMLGKEVDILVEKTTSRDANFVKGRTRCWKSVVFEAPNAVVGSTQRVVLHSFNNQTFIGKWQKTASAA
jgi:tRNA-2-methylthio-N6-dimethylallyladenosine synthase